MNDYEKSIQAIRQYDSKISVKEWNKIAVQFNYLSAKSLVRLSGNKNFLELNKKTRKN
jgi:hypothetical protein